MTAFVGKAVILKIFIVVLRSVAGCPRIVEAALEALPRRFCYSPWPFGAHAKNTILVSGQW
jgi:hypothetical protein